MLVCAAQAALDVFPQEPPPKDHPLVNRPEVVCTPHLGASTTEAQEGVAVEIAEAVIGALKASKGLLTHPACLDVSVATGKWSAMSLSRRVHHDAGGICAAQSAS